MATLGAMFANTGVKKAETPPQRVTKWIHYTKLKDNAAQYCNERDKKSIRFWNWHLVPQEQKF